MAQKNSLIVTIGIDVWAEYTCSACGKENRLADRAQVTGSAVSILALKKLGKERDILPVLPGGLISAGLQCRCQCGHRESWSGIRSPGLEKAMKTLLWLLLALAAAACLVHTAAAELTGILLAAALVAAAVLAGLALFGLLRRRRAARQLKMLPESAFPTIYLQ